MYPRDQSRLTIVSIKISYFMPRVAGCKDPAGLEALGDDRKSGYRTSVFLSGSHVASTCLTWDLYNLVRFSVDFF